MRASGVGVARTRAEGWRGVAMRRAMALVFASLMAIGLAGCGGGISIHGNGFSIGVTINGRPHGGWIESGTRRDVSMRAGESISFDASEPVEWTLYAGNAAIPADGSTVYYGGASIRATAVSDARIVVDTAAPGRLPQAVPITLVATSIFDAALVATIDVLIF